MCGGFLHVYFRVVRLCGVFSIYFFFLICFSGCLFMHGGGVVRVVFVDLHFGVCE